MSPERQPASGRALLVEDDPLVRAVIGRELAGQGYEVTEAPDGHTALKFVQGASRPFDVVITDLAMPRMDGRELAERLGGIQPGVPVLFISGHPDDQLAPALADPRRPFLQKPFTAEELIAWVDDVLRRVP